ncbi:MAG: hypothetical protein HC936_06985 [Leptolyngbyaceae cyanobacterium SU_3_3]|nr:hypothetical protein [Leptolyngbyaceae cyanobacterium SU_3_3]NJR49787.1 hypothetical protein [Leptolyngbyaceae cyanobacterium CSU_1_3]
MDGSPEMTLVERVESVKAGLFAGLSVAIAFSILALINDLILASQFQPLLGLQRATTGGWLSGAIAIVAGLLFGITYRYVVRQDQNSHLKSGAVLAFGLVRGLAQIDVGLATQGALLPFVVLALESILLFAIARLALDWAMNQGWLRSFRGLS